MNEENKRNRPEQKILLKTLIIGISILLLAIFFLVKKLNQTVQAEGAESAQDTFQGSAEISPALQADCQTSVQKIFSTKNCDEKRTEFFSRLNSCKMMFFSIDAQVGVTTEGSYADLLTTISSCYLKGEPKNDGSSQNKTNNNEKAADVLKKGLALEPWDMSWGPASCPSRTVIAAHLESLELQDQFVCMQNSEINKLFAELKNKNFSILKTLVTGQDIVSHGFIQTDVACPEKVTNIISELQKHLKESFTLAKASRGENSGENSSETTNTKAESSVLPVDILDDSTQERRYQLQFALDQQGCIHFKSLLLPSDESFE